MRHALTYMYKAIHIINRMAVSMSSLMRVFLIDNVVHDNVSKSFGHMAWPLSFTIYGIMKLALHYGKIIRPIRRSLKLLCQFIVKFRFICYVLYILGNADIGFWFPVYNYNTIYRLSVRQLWTFYDFQLLLLAMNGRMYGCTDSQTETMRVYCEYGSCYCLSKKLRWRRSK